MGTKVTLPENEPQKPEEKAEKKVPASEFACPKCGSLKTGKPDSYILWSAETLYREKEYFKYYCENCGYTWSVPSKSEK